MALSNLNRNKTAGDLVSEIGVEIGLPKIQDPFTSNDPQYQRMIQLLNVAGNALLELYPWARLQVRGSITTVPGQGGYPLPADFLSMADDTIWRQNMTLYPGIGSLSPQTWQALLNIPVVGTISVIYRERLGGISVLPVPDSVYSFNFEYISRGWVTDVNQSNFRDNVTTANDIVLLDPLLIGRYLKLRFLEALGFDTQAAKDDFNLVLEAVSSRDKSAPVIATAKSQGVPLISAMNLPETNYGF